MQMAQAHLNFLANFADVRNECQRSFTINYQHRSITRREHQPKRIVPQYFRVTKLKLTRSGAHAVIGIRLNLVTSGGAVRSSIGKMAHPGFPPSVSPLRAFSLTRNT